jgi:hypothetical protein
LVLAVPHVNMSSLIKLMAKLITRTDRFLAYSAALVLMGAMNLAHADSVTFTIGPQPTSIPTVGGEAAGPYPGQLQGSDIGQFLCLDGNVVTFWGSVITGTEAHPQTEQEDEAAFLGSLLLHDASQAGVILNSLSNPNPDPTYTQAFMNSYSGPITYAVWQIFGTLTATQTANKPAATQSFVDLAETAYNNIFNNPNSALYAEGQSFLQSVWIFRPVPAGSNQRFITAVGDELLFPPKGPDGPVAPEPGTLPLLAGGGLLVLIGMRRRVA